MNNTSLLNCSVDDASSQMLQADYGAHYLLVYSDLAILREMYSNYVQNQTKENNEIILINPFYETTDSVRQILSKSDINVSKFEKAKELVIIDSLRQYFGVQPNIVFIRNLVKYAKQIGKNGVSVLGDLGAYTHKSKYDDLVDYELSLPIKFDLNLRGFCLYHQNDFDKFSGKQKQELIKHHGKALKIEIK